MENLEQWKETMGELGKLDAQLNELKEKKREAESAVHATLTRLKAEREPLLAARLHEVLEDEARFWELLGLGIQDIMFFEPGVGGRGFLPLGKLKVALSLNRLSEVPAATASTHTATGEKNEN